MYQHTIRHQHQVLPSPKERDSPPPYPQCSHYIMARARSSPRSPAAPVTSPAPQNTLFPPQQRTQDLSWCQRNTRTQPGKGCEPPPRCNTHFPRFHRATRGLASLPPPGRRDTARRRFPTRPGGELPSPAAKDEPPVDSDLAGAVGGRSGAGARAARRGTLPCPGGGRGDGRGNAGGSALQPPAPGAGVTEEGAARAP